MHALLTDFKDMDTVPTGPQIQPDLSACSEIWK